jgi:hypothetical protein
MHGDENVSCAPAPILQGSAMKRHPPTLHLFGNRLTNEKSNSIANEKKRLEALAAERKSGSEREFLMKKIRQLDTVDHIEEWLSSPGLQAPR